jgi:uncharacterized SAM-binding protein YcdF (DUF218 family)
MDGALETVAKIALRPDTWLFAAFTLALLLAAGRRRRVGLALGALALAACLAIAAAPVATPLLRPLETRFPTAPQVADPAGIVVLGGSEERARFAGWGQPQVSARGDRYLAALTLAARFPGAVILFSGGGPGGRAEADMARAVFLGAGIAPGRLILEDRARSTWENATLSLPLRPPGTEAGPWLLVTSAFHVPRAVGSFCAAGWEGIVPWPADHRTAGPAARLRPGGWDFPRRLGDLTTALHEWAALAGYRAAGRTDAVLPEGCPPD